MTGTIATPGRPTPRRGGLRDAIVLFDWNGTVVLDGERARLSLNRALRPHGLDPLDADAFADRFRLPMAELLRELGVPAAGLDRAEADWNAAMTAADVPARAGARDGLLALRRAGAHVGVVSAASRAAVLSDLARLGFAGLFDVVEGGCADKPAALERLGASRSRCVYVGDTEYDMRSAVAAGFQPIGVSGGYTTPARLRAAGAQHIVGDVRELLDIPDLGVVRGL